MELPPDPITELILPEPPPVIVNEVEVKTEEEEVELATTPTEMTVHSEEEISATGGGVISPSIEDPQGGNSGIEDNTEVFLKSERVERVEETAAKDSSVSVPPPVTSNTDNKDNKKLASADDDYDEEEDTFRVPCIVPLSQPLPAAAVVAPSSSASSSAPSSGKSTTPRTAAAAAVAGPSGSRPVTVPLHFKSKKELDEEDEREKMQLLVSNFTDGQYDRYEMFRRSTFPKAAIKRLMQTITGNAVSQNVVIAMSGIAKVFVGEVVEEALDAMERVGETGPLRPKQLREAVRRLRARGNRCAVPRSNTRRYNPFPL